MKIERKYEEGKIKYGRFGTNKNTNNVFEMYNTFFSPNPFARRSRKHMRSDLNMVNIYKFEMLGHWTTEL